MKSMSKSALPASIATFDYADETTLRFEGFFFKDDDGRITFQHGDAEPSF